MKPQSTQRSSFLYAERIMFLEFSEYFSVFSVVNFFAMIRRTA